MTSSFSRYRSPGWTQSIAGVALVFCVFLSSIYLGSKKPLDDPGLGWHLLTGKIVVEMKSVPRVDPFLFTAVERSWVSDQWLGDVLLWAAYLAGGWFGLSFLTFFCFCLAYLAFPIKSLGSKYSLLIYLAVLPVCFSLSQVQYLARPVSFGLCFFSWLYFSMHKNSLIGKQTSYLFIFLLFYFWSNIHPSFILGFILLICMSDLNNLLKLIKLLVVAFLGTIIGPYNIHIYDSILTLGGSDYFQRLNSEWHAIELGSFEGTLFLFLMFVSLLSMRESVRQSSAKFHALLRAILLFLFFILTLRSIRFLPFFCLVSIPYAMYGAKLLATMLIPAFIQRRYHKLNLVAPTHGGVYAGVLLVLVASIFNNSYAGLQRSGPSNERYPYKIMEHILSNAPNAVIATTPDFGGFITWSCRLHHCRALVDDRNQLLGEKFTRAYLQAYRYPLRIEFFRSMGATHIIMPNGIVAEDFKRRHPELEFVMEDAAHFLVNVDSFDDH